MSIYKIQGTVHEAGEIQEIQGRNGNTYRKQQIVLVQTDDRGYDIFSAFTAFGNPVDETEDLRVGEEVEITFSVTAREYNGRWYSDLSLVHARRLAPAQNTQRNDFAPNQDRRAAAKAKVEAVLNGTASGAGQDDDLPFD